MSARYPIFETPINLNLTEDTSSATINKEDLLELVRWIKAINERKTSCDRNGLGQSPRKQPSTIDGDSRGNGLQCRKIRSHREEKD